MASQLFSATPRRLLVSVAHVATQARASARASLLSDVRGGCDISQEAKLLQEALPEAAGAKLMKVTHCMSFLPLSEHSHCNADVATNALMLFLLKKQFLVYFLEITE